MRRPCGGVEPRLSAEKLAELAAIVEAGPDREKDGVVRWRRIDLQRVVKERFGVDYCERYIGTLLKKLGFSHISARPRHPAQNGEIVDAFKKNFPRALSAHLEGLPQTTPIEIWFQDEARIGQRTGTSVSGREPGHGLANLPTSVTKTPIFLGRFARHAE